MASIVGTDRKFLGRDGQVMTRYKPQLPPARIEADLGRYL
jgi:glutathione peroxidase-family protein